MDLAEESAIASGANLRRHSTAYVYEDKFDGKEKVASGTLVKIGGRILLATVRHSSPRSIDSISFVQRAGRFISLGNLALVKKRTVSNEVDVALFEIDEMICQRGFEPIGLDRIHDAGTGRCENKARLFGYPGKYVVPRDGTRGFHALSYGCEPVLPIAWKSISKNSLPYDEKYHIIVNFDPDVITYGKSYPSLPSDLPAPFGMSGGGLWQRKKPLGDAALWVAEDLCLVGIQSSVFKEQYLKIVQIIHWLKLVSEEYPEMKSDLIDRFPRLLEID